MLAEYVTRIQNNPDWIGYGLWMIAVLVLVCIALLIWHRAKSLTRAEVNVAGVTGQVSSLEDKVTEQAQQLADMREELARSGALKEQWQTDHDDLIDTRHALGQRQAEVASLKVTIEHQRETDGTLKTQFTALANEVMKAQSADFKKSNQEQLTQVLQPLKEHIGRFEVELREVHKSADKDRVALKTEIETLTKRSLEVSEEAHNLTQALKGDSQKQGAWGEMILASILEHSGLREGYEYETQKSHRNDEGGLVRPDVIVNLPNGRKLVIDSKVSLVAYDRAMNADTPEAAKTAIQAHVASVKKHIDELSEQKYHQLDDGAIEYVIMFMPIESAFSETVRTREDLVTYAAKKNVLIATPTNLMLALKTVENLWSVEKRNRYALDIAKQAGSLYDKFSGFIDDMEKIGKQLKSVQDTHEKAVSKLTTGRGNLVGQAEKLKKLGARATKQIDIDHESEDDLLPPPDSPS